MWEVFVLVDLDQYPLVEVELDLDEVVPMDTSLEQKVVDDDGKPFVND